MNIKSICLCALVVTLSSVCGAPVNPQPHIPDVKENADPMDSSYLSLEYKKYLEEVVQLLEADPEFKKELDKMSEEESKAGDGQIAHYLQFANKNTRTKLDELKRMEVRRLRDLHKKLMQETAQAIRAGDRDPSEIPNVDKGHVDHDNPHTFEIDDLKKLIKKTTEDLAGVDKQRKEEFKKYEMNKEHDYRQKLKHSDKEAAEKLKQEHEENLKNHKDHPKLHHPGSKDQLKEVWAAEDHLNPEEFDPKAFFGLHDIDGDGYLNTAEIEALFQTELDKMYNSSNPEDDEVERNEEMNRMREHVFSEIDGDGDGLVSLEEFLKSTKSGDFNKDESWKTLDEEEPYNSNEFDEYEKALGEQEEKLQDKHAQPNEAHDAEAQDHPNPPHEQPDTQQEHHEDAAAGAPDARQPENPPAPAGH